jgi:hypothetical protein
LKIQFSILNPQLPMPNKKPHKKKTDEAFEDTPRILSADEKRELILAHAAVRKPQDPVQRVSLWAGVAVALIAILGGWWITVGAEVKRSIEGTPDSMQAMKDDLDRFRETAENNPIVNQPALPGPTSEAAAASFGEIMKLLLEGEELPTSTRRDDLLAPSAPASPTSTSGGEDATSTADVKDDESSYPVDPFSPGLIPDPEYSL